MHMTYMRHPMENMDTLGEIENYPFPDFASADGSHQAEQVKKIKERDLIALGDMQMTIWECAWYMRSMEELFCDMMMEDEKAEFLFDKVTELSMTRALSYAKAGVDVLFLGDDIGMQHTIMMSEELYTTWIQPRLKKIIDAVKAVNPDILIFYHSCGFIEPLNPYLIEAGIDVLNWNPDGNAERDSPGSKGSDLEKPGHCWRKGRAFRGSDPYAGAGGAAGEYPGLCGCLQDLQKVSRLYYTPDAASAAETAKECIRKKTLLRERPENERTANYSAALVENADFRWGKNNFFK